MILVPVALSWDSLFASTIIGFSGVDRSRRIGFAVAFGAFDAAASWMARYPAMLHGWFAWLISPHFSLFLWSYLIAIGCLPWIVHPRARRLALYSLPILLSLDNLASPTTNTCWLSLVAIGVTSTAMSAIGFALAGPLETSFEKVRSLHQATVRLPS
jgi:hypothetical protein